MADIFLIPTTATTSVSWTTGANWQGGTAPGTGDTAHLGAAALKFDSTLAHSGIQLARLVIYDTFTGSLGGSGTNVLQIGASIIDCHVQAVAGQNGQGSPLINLNTGSNASEINVFGSRTPPGTDSGLPPIRFIGSATAGSSLTVHSGYVGFGVNNVSETGEVQTVNVSGSQAVLRIGGGVTLATVKVGAGSLALNSAVTTLSQYGGNIISNGDWTATTLNLYGGTATLNHRKSSGVEVTTLNLAGGILDLTQKSEAFAATNTTLTRGSIRQFAPSQFTPGTITLTDGGNRTVNLSTAA